MTLYTIVALLYCYRMHVGGSENAAGSQWQIPKSLHVSSLGTGVMKSPMSLQIQAQVSLALMWPQEATVCGSAMVSVKYRLTLSLVLILSP